MRALKAIGILFLALLLAGTVTGVAFFASNKASTEQQQAQLESFYTTPSPLPPGRPGDIIRSEPLTPAPPLRNANSYRVLYRTEKPDGTSRVSGAMLFIPTSSVPAGGRKIVSWAHPTAGMGDQCAPSRTKNPAIGLDWLQGMLDLGWIVTATDYAGLGTEGIEYYLVGQNEAIDVVNAVRMAQRFPGSQASDTYGVYGHSQGGHAAMWAGSVGPEYAPELKLVGVAGAAPAAELGALVNQLWDLSIAWVIGGEVLISYPHAYPGLDPTQIASASGLKHYEALAQDCLIAGIAKGTGLQNLGNQVFTSNPMKNPQWAAAIDAQTPKPLPPSMPALVIESVNDGVVIPQSIATMQQKWCKAGSSLQVDWLGPLRGKVDKPSAATHMFEGAVGGALTTSWLVQRFEGANPVTNCDTPPLVAPSS